jgi:amino acid adenylation domain-containing protein
MSPQALKKATIVRHNQELPIVRRRDIKPMNGSQEKLIHERFERKAELTPNDTAIIFGQAKLTYRDLNHCANQLARYLIDHGIVPGMKVGLCMEPSLELIIGSLAILKAHGIYLPLDPTYPEARLRYMLADSGTSFVVTQHPLRERFTLDGQDALCVDDEGIREVLSDYSHSNVDLSIDAQEVAYIVYTSGSTGKPKGVEGTHKSLLNRLQWGWETFPYKSGEVSCQKTPISFVDSLAEIYAPLIGGCPLVIVPARAAKNPALLVELLARNDISRLLGVPSLIKAICEVLGKSGQSLPCLEMLVSSGEALTVTLANEVFRRLPDVSLVNLYGSSEVGADVSYFVVPRGLTRSGFVPIGKPISNTILRVLDGTLMVIPGGDVGELYVGGPGLARGYLNRPDETASTFIADPFSEEPDARLCRTGDLVRLLTDGNLEYCGRSDHQVKIRGVRVELGEIEQVLMDLDGVGDAAVVAHQRITGETYLTAYVTPEGSLEPETTPLDRVQLQHELRGRLPDSMVPSHFVFLDHFPLTDNGKIDRVALPAPDETALPRRSYAAPSNANEQMLAAIWSEVLGIDVGTIGVQDEFFALGGHSFALLKLVFRVSEAFDCPLDVETFVRHSTIAALAESIVQRTAVRTHTAYVNHTFAFECHLSPPQIRILNGIDIDALQIRRHNMEFLLCVQADRNSVAEALAACQARHDIFRIQRIWKGLDGQLMQHFGGSLDRQAVDLTDIYPNLLSFIDGAKHHRTALQPGSGSLSHLAIYEDAKGETYVYGLINHLIFDGYSQHVLIGELARYVRNSASELPTSVSFYDRIRRFSSDEMRKRFVSELPYWETLVDKRVDPLVYSEHDDLEGAKLPKTTLREHRASWDKLKRRDQKYRSAVLLASCIHSVGTYYQMSDIHARIVGSGRMVMDDVNDALTVGYVSDHYPQVFEVGSDVTKTLANVRRRQQELPRSGVAYPWLRHIFACERLVSGAQIDDFPFHFNYLPYPDFPSTLVSDQTDLLGEPDPFLGDDNYAGLAFFVTESLDCVSIGLYRNTGYVRQGSVDAILDMISNNVQTLVRLDQEEFPHDPSRE